MQDIRSAPPEPSSPVEALLDVYARSLRLFCATIARLSHDEYERNLLPDEELCSVREVCAHLIGAGVIYVNMIRERQGMPALDHGFQTFSASAIQDRSAWLLDRTEESLARLRHASDEEICSFRLDATWGQQYDLEQLLEHAIVHVLRHNRQVERLSSRP